MSVDSPKDPLAVQQITGDHAEAQFRAEANKVANQNWFPVYATKSITEFDKVTLEYEPLSRVEERFKKQKLSLRPVLNGIATKSKVPPEQVVEKVNSMVSVMGLARLFGPYMQQGFKVGTDPVCIMSGHVTTFNTSRHHIKIKDLLFFRPPEADRTESQVPRGHSKSLSAHRFNWELVPIQNVEPRKRYGVSRINMLSNLRRAIAKGAATRNPFFTAMYTKLNDDVFTNAVEVKEIDQFVHKVPMDTLALTAAMNIGICRSQAGPGNKTDVTLNPTNRYL